MKKLLILIAAMTMITGSAYAADWAFYGNARVETFYSDVDTVGSTTDEKNFEEQLAGNGRIGANVKVSDELTGRFEYGDSANMRLLYGKWNFGAGSLLVGQDYTPAMMAFGNQVYEGATGLIGYGALYGGRVAQIKLRFGDFSIAAIQPNNINTAYTAVVSGAVGTAAGLASYLPAGVTPATATPAQLVTQAAAIAAPTNVQLASQSAAAGAATAAYAANLSYEYTIPRIEASYFYDLGPLRLRGQGGFATVEYTDANPATALSYDFDAYVVGVGATYTAAGFYVTAAVYTGENLSVLGIATTDSDSPSLPVALATGGVTDAETDAWQIFAGYTFNDMFSVEAGYGEEETDIGTANVDANAYYANATITVAPGVFIVPEFGVQDKEDFDGTKKTYFGAKWQINF